MATVHASAVLIGARAILIRGPSGSGKSRLVHAVLRAAGCPDIPFARLVADDRVLLEAAHGRLLARPPKALAGLLEIRGVGILRLPYEAVAQIDLVVDLQGAADGSGPGTAFARLPSPEEAHTEILGVSLRRVVAGPGRDPLTLVWARGRIATDAAADVATDNGSRTV